MKVYIALTVFVTSCTLVGMDFTYFSNPRDRAILEKSVRSLVSISSQAATIPYDIIESRIEQFSLPNERPYIPINPLLSPKKHNSLVSYWTSDASADTIPECAESFTIESINYTQTPLSGYMIYVPLCDDKDEQQFLQRRAEIICLHRHYVAQKALKYNKQIQAIEEKQSVMTVALQSLSTQAGKLYMTLENSSNAEIDPEIQKLSDASDNLISEIDDQELRNICKGDNFQLCCCSEPNMNMNGHSIDHLQKLGNKALVSIPAIYKDFDTKIQKLKTSHQEKYYLKPDDQQFFYDRAAALVQQDCSPALRYLGKKIKRGALCIDANHPTYLERYEHLSLVAKNIDTIKNKN